MVLKLSVRMRRRAELAVLGLNLRFLAHAWNHESLNQDSGNETESWGLKNWSIDCPPTPQALNPSIREAIVMFSLCLRSESALLAPLQLQLLFKVEEKKKRKKTSLERFIIIIIFSALRMVSFPLLLLTAVSVQLVSHHSYSHCNLKGAQTKPQQFSARPQSRWKGSHCLLQWALKAGSSTSSAAVNNGWKGMDKE